MVFKSGVNNTWDLDPWDPMERRSEDEIEDEIVRDVSAMIAMAQAAGIAIAICSMLPTDIPSNGNTPVRNRLIARTNERWRASAKAAGAVYVDYHRHLVDADGLTLKPGLADDGLHPHVGGYGLMADVLVDTLAAAGITVLSRRPIRM
ncbi:MAG TPA: GDSL-type esterase/lipase family protein [Chloroflexota bacterium]|nr:GDSL-type esterase/lipase family protein [Chloroflexota bacterium]